MKADNKKTRIEYIDIAKGIGILLMIIGHMPLKNEYIKNFIYSFHMPLFFLISGYFFKYQDNRKCLKKIFVKLIIPYIITCVLIIGDKIIRVILDNSFGGILNVLKEWGLASLYGSGFSEPFGITAIGAIWFLLALGFATIFMNYIYNKKHRYIYVLLISYVGYKTSKFIWLPFSIQAGMVAVVFIYLGILMKEKNIVNRSLSIVEYVFLILMMIFNIKYGGRLYMVTNTYENGFLDIIVALGNSYLCIKFSILIEKFTKVIKWFLKFIGENSLICLCVHLISLDCFQWKTWFNILNNIGIHNEFFIAFSGNFIWVFIVLIIIKTIKKLKSHIRITRQNNSLGRI